MRMTTGQPAASRTTTSNSPAGGRPRSRRAGVTSAEDGAAIGWLLQRRRACSTAHVIAEPHHLIAGTTPADPPSRPGTGADRAPRGRPQGRATPGSAYLREWRRLRCTRRPWYSSLLVVVGGASSPAIRSIAPGSSGVSAYIGSGSFAGYFLDEFGVKRHQPAVGRHLPPPAGGARRRRRGAPDCHAPRLRSPRAQRRRGGRHGPPRRARDERLAGRGRRRRRWRPAPGRRRSRPATTAWPAAKLHGGARRPAFRRAAARLRR